MREKKCKMKRKCQEPPYCLVPFFYFLSRSVMNQYKFNEKICFIGKPSIIFGSITMLCIVFNRFLIQTGKVMRKKRRKAFM